ncbi:hypothetical protein [Sulfuriferula nivalis]|uniref:Uncharacterized protein n=1 Tax=Sulfuriferula nivalis TaxID=2675298 RepID=A0A809SFZ5_9PROT|nr:hypothetical protein [Sulfuriferula nivalis]BBO99479.1 hypothetical protein SFSGTM_01880 [Sulfuriferula nivalis]
MAAWRINAGEYYKNMRFGIVVPRDLGYSNFLNELVSEYPIDIMQVTQETAETYQYFWPMSLLDGSYTEDVIIFAPPNILVVNDIARLVETAYKDNVAIVPSYFGAAPESADTLLSTNFMVLPKNAFANVSGKFLSMLMQSGFPGEVMPNYHLAMSILARAFTAWLKVKKIDYRLIDEHDFHELGGQQIAVNHEHACVDYDKLVIFSVADAPENDISWSRIFYDSRALQKFLEHDRLCGAWLYFQRDLRHIYTSFGIELARRNLFQTTNSPYYIYGLDFMQQSAGIRALHYLCHALNESGQEAYITCENVSPQLRTPVLTEAVLMQHYVAGRKPIMVYPEIVSGDPMAVGGVVVRWLLNQAGHIGGDTTFAAEDIIFAYDDQHLTQDVRGEILHIPTGNTAIFNNDDNPYDDARDLVCYYAHKYLYNGGQLTEQVQGAISLCKDQVLTHAEIAAILRRSKLLYVYESTSLIEEALLCGCPVSVIETDYWRNNMANYVYTGDIGVVMDDSPESIALATANVHKYREVHEDVVVKDAWWQIDRFVEITQRAAKLKAKCN